MGREVKRVDLDFHWPLDKVWSGYQWTEEQRERWAEDDCPDCTEGWSPRAWELKSQWYGNAPFCPEDNGSTPLTAETPAVRAFAERNVAHAPGYYGTGEPAITCEARRLADLWNGMLAHHLNEDDVAALRAVDRLPRGWTHRFDPTITEGSRWVKRDPEPEITAEMLNEEAIRGGLIGDAVQAYDLIVARCTAEGVSDTCATCGAHGSLERYPGQRDEAEAWERTEPPAGEGWQLWETVSEGSPISPVFASAEELAQWMTTPASAWGVSRPMTIEQARGFVKVGSSLGTFVQDAGGLHDGAEWVGTREALKGHEQDG